MQWRRFSSLGFSMLAITLLSGFRACSPEVPVGEDGPRVGDPCSPSHPSDFRGDEVYVENDVPRTDCGELACVTYELRGNPTNLRSAGCPAGPATCVDDLSPAPAGEAVPSAHGDRLFCSCRCAPSALDPDAPLCTCPTGFACSESGYCASPAVIERPVAGRLCTPVHIPDGGFEASEVYVESAHAECGEMACIVFHLDGDPTNRSSASCPGGEESCVVDGAWGPARPDDARRSACGCVCNSTTPGVPSCACENGQVCSSDGFCVLPELL